MLDAAGAGAVKPVCVIKPSTQFGLSVGRTSCDVSVLSPVKGGDSNGCKSPKRYEA